MRGKTRIELNGGRSMHPQRQSAGVRSRAFDPNSVVHAHMDATNVKLRTCSRSSAQKAGRICPSPAS